ncbi:MAG TPA: peptidylprolyl isomerase [Candidatus Angelobacter sp.]|jgi:peptidyl-prolyl cis-trans isomerase SurA|nr:peptidylprolyl isomerase [Candidatus Angelobacter sp.]
MFRKPSLFAFAFLFAVVLHADNIVDEIIARVDSAIITRADLERGKQSSQQELKDRYQSSWEAKWNERQKDVLRDLIDEQLLLGKGKQLGITGDTELVKRLDELRKQMSLETMEDLEKAAQQQGVSFEDFKDRIRNQIIAQQVVSREVGSRVRISNEEIQKWYEDHKSDIAAPEAVRLSEILVSTQPPKPAVSDKDKGAQPTAQLPEDPNRVAQAKAKAEKLLEELRKGGDFAALAKQNSDGPTAAQGGEIGAFKREEMAKELVDKTFGLKPGEITDVIRTRQGFIIFKVLDHQQAGVPPLKQIEDRVREQIYGEKLEPAARAYLTKLREEAYIDIKSGYVDTGASPNQSKPVIVASADGPAAPAKHAKKKKHFLLF